MRHRYQCGLGEGHNCQDLGLVGISYPGAFAKYAKVPAKVAETRFRAADARVSAPIGDRRLLSRVRAANGVAKRIFDLVTALTALIVLSPALLTIALLVKLSDGGPVLFRHPRIGRHGEPFGCLKFRTMAVNADARREKILREDPQAAAEWAINQKLREAPRVTKLGSFLRMTSLDELPQLINVIRGDMSIIGPRPITRSELTRYGRDRRFYLLVRPGITGLWQVSGRSSVSYEARVRFDREYLRNRDGEESPSLSCEARSSRRRAALGRHA